MTDSTKSSEYFAWLEKVKAEEAGFQADRTITAARELLASPDCPGTWHPAVTEALQTIFFQRTRKQVVVVDKT